MLAPVLSDQTTVARRLECRTLSFAPLAAERSHRHLRSMASARKKRILVLNAASGGATGNTAVLLERATRHLRPHATVTTLVLASGKSYVHVRRALARCDALVIGTGTYWDSWSHWLQRMLEDATADEGTALWLGKPAAVLVTMHAVGGKGVLSRLQGVLMTLGCAVPPMSGLVYSLVNQAAIQAEATGADDLWCQEDVAIVCDNLVAALTPGGTYSAWPTNRRSFGDKWIT